MVEFPECRHHRSYDVTLTVIIINILNELPLQNPEWLVVEEGIPNVIFFVNMEI